MVSLRRVLRSIATTWLLCQVATMAATPVVLWTTVHADALECTCSHGEHAICPMHHKPAKGTDICVMRSADGSNIAAFGWLLPVGLVPSPAPTAAPDVQGPSRPIDPTAVSLRPTPPEPPPPRA